MLHLFSMRTVKPVTLGGVPAGGPGIIAGTPPASVVGATPPPSVSQPASDCKLIAGGSPISGCPPHACAIVRPRTADPKLIALPMDLAPSLGNKHDGVLRN